MSRRSLFLLAATLVLLHFTIIVLMLSPLHGARRTYYSSGYHRYSLHGGPSVAWCKDLRFKPLGPVVALVSHPGSGNTWLRYLLQQVTGIMTGSIYMDYGLRTHGFPAENITDGTVLVVKTHEAPPLGTDRFQAAVLLIRHPKDAILAEYNRLHKGHIGTAPKSAFKKKAHEHRTTGRHELRAGQPRRHLPAPEETAGLRPVYRRHVLRTRQGAKPRPRHGHRIQPPTQSVQSTEPGERR